MSHSLLPHVSITQTHYPVISQATIIPGLSFLGPVKAIEDVEKFVLNPSVGDYVYIEDLDKYLIYEGITELSPKAPLISIQDLGISFEYMFVEMGKYKYSFHHLKGKTLVFSKKRTKVLSKRVLTTIDLMAMEMLFKGSEDVATFIQKLRAYLGKEEIIDLSNEELLTFMSQDLKEVKRYLREVVQFCFGLKGYTHLPGWTMSSIGTQSLKISSPLIQKNWLGHAEL